MKKKGIDQLMICSMLSLLVILGKTYGCDCTGTHPGNAACYYCSYGVWTQYAWAECGNDGGCDSENCIGCSSGCECEYECDEDENCCDGNCRECCVNSDCPVWCEICSSGSCVANWDSITAITTQAEFDACASDGIRIPTPDYTPGSNGCSSPLGNNPTLCEHTSFEEACDAHDHCYGTCYSVKSACDTNFGDAMLNVCGELTGLEAATCSITCYSWAAVYVIAVELVGQSYFDNGQIAGCSCCNF